MLVASHLTGFNSRYRPPPIALTTVIFPAGGVSSYPNYAVISASNVLTTYTNPIPGSATIYDVTWNGLVFCVITSVGCYLSSDGLSWSAGNSMGASNGTFTQIRASTTTGYMCAINTTNKVTFSTDNGTSWSEATLTDHADGALTNRILGLNSNRFAVTRIRSGVGYYAHITSESGTSFGTPTKLAATSDYGTANLYYLNDSIVIAANTTLSNGWYYNGSWTSYTPGSNSPLNTVPGPHHPWANSKILGVYNTAGPVRRIVSNTDSSAPPTSNWSIITSDQGNVYAPMWWNGSLYIANSYFSTRGDSQVWAVYSSDGITWSQHSGDASNIGYCGASSNTVVY